MKIITGYTGTPHVNSDDMSAFQQGVVGVEDFVLYNGTDFTATATTGSTISLSKAEIVIQGTHCRIDGTETVTIDAGTQGLYRHDLIVARYNKEVGTDIESVEIDVVQGVAAESNSVVPELTKNDIRNGGTTREVALFDVLLYGSVIQSITQVIPSVDSLCTQQKNIATNKNSISSLTATTNSHTGSISSLNADVKALKKKTEFDGSLKAAEDYSKAALKTWVSKYDTKGKPSILAAGVFVQDQKSNDKASVRVYSNGQVAMVRNDTTYPFMYIQKGSVTFKPKASNQVIGTTAIPKSKIGTTTVSSKSYNVTGDGSRLDVKAEKGEVVEKKITFPKAFTEEPMVVATPKTSRPDICHTSVRDITTKGFTLYFCKDNDTQTEVGWIAVGKVAD